MYCLLFIVCCCSLRGDVLFVVYCLLLFVVRCLSFVGRRLLFVACCALMCGV